MLGEAGVCYVTLDLVRHCPRSSATRSHKDMCKVKKDKVSI